MFEEIFEDFKKKLENVITHTKKDLQGMHTGRANTNLLDKVIVEVYGSPTPLNQIATVSVLDSQNISVKAWDRNNAAAIEKAILASDLGLQPQRMGELIRIPIQPMTADKRKQLVKTVYAKGEQSKISIRNTRRNAIDDLKSLQDTDEKVSKDEHESNIDKIDKTTKDFIAQIDDIVKEKEKTILNN